MSLVNAPIGIQPDWHPTGQMRPTAYVSYSANDLLIPSGTNIAFYKFQPVKLLIGSGGTINGVTVATGAMVLSPVTANTDTPLGIFAGVEYVDSTGKPWVQNNWPASQVLLAGARQVVYVWDDPELIYRAQLDGAPSVGAGYALTGKQVNVSNFAAGNTLTGISQCTLSGTIVATGSQGQFRIIKLWNDISGLATDPYPIYEVKLQYSPFVAAKTSL
jgi:hypothetical protein